MSPVLSNICLSPYIYILYWKGAWKEVNVITVTIYVCVPLYNATLFKAVPINNFIHGSRHMCLTVIGCLWRAPRSCSFWRWSATSVEILHLMTWILFLELEQLWDLLHWGAPMHSYELNYSLYHLWQKIGLITSKWGLIRPPCVQVSLLKTRTFLHPSPIHYFPQPRKRFLEENNTGHSLLSGIFLLFSFY